MNMTGCYKWENSSFYRFTDFYWLFTVFFCLSFIFSGFLWAWLAISSNHVPKQPEDAAGRQKPQEQQWLVPLCNLAWRRPCLKPFCSHLSCCDPVIREQRWAQLGTNPRYTEEAVMMRSLRTVSKLVSNNFGHFFSAEWMEMDSGQQWENF